MTYPVEITTAKRYPPVVEAMSIDVDGTVLEGTCDVNLATKWAAHVHGEEWATMSMVARSEQVGYALHELRRAAHAAGDISSKDDDE